MKPLPAALLAPRQVRLSSAMGPFYCPGEVAEALNAATAIGDDRLQQQTQGRVVPESFTHGSSEQRVRWFMRGMSSGRPKQCDTFSIGTL